jgi:hypothetical protein
VLWWIALRLPCRGAVLTNHQLDRALLAPHKLLARLAANQAARAEQHVGEFPWRGHVGAVPGRELDESPPRLRSGALDVPEQLLVFLACCAQHIGAGHL